MCEKWIKGGGGSPIRISGQPAHGDADVGPGMSGHQFSSDDAVFELCLVDLSNTLPATPVKVSRAAPVANGDVTGFAFSR